MHMCIGKQQTIGEKVVLNIVEVKFLRKMEFNQTFGISIQAVPKRNDCVEQSLNL